MHNIFFNHYADAPKIPNHFSIALLFFYLSFSISGKKFLRIKKKICKNFSFVAKFHSLQLYHSLEQSFSFKNLFLNCDMKIFIEVMNQSLNTSLFNSRITRDKQKVIGIFLKIDFVRKASKLSR